jgi:predicted ArsR family transcriptional regulator
MLTDSADSMFRKSYDKFVLDMLREVRKNDGADKVHKIFGWRKDRILKQRKEALTGLGSIDETMHGLKNLMEGEGYLVDLDKEEDKYLLKLYNCPISKISSEFNEACMLELQLYRELLNRNASMVQCMGQGSGSCVFSIPVA